MTIPESLSPALRAQAEATTNRWRGFVAKVRARVAAVEAEAIQGLDGLIAAHADDAGPMGAAFTAVKTRFFGIDRKVADAWEKIDEQLDNLCDADGGHGAIALRDTLQSEYISLRESIESTHEYIEMKKSADWARALKRLADVDRERPVNCSQCGGRLEVTVFWAASNVTCPHCKAVNGVKMCAAGGLFYQGNGLHALAREAAWELRAGEQQAQQASLRNAPDAIKNKYLAGARAYWTRYYETILALNPGHPHTLEEAVTAKLAHYTAW